MTEQPTAADQTQTASSSRLRLPHPCGAVPIHSAVSSPDGNGPALLILAWGNDLRQDDGAGLALAAQIAQAAPAGPLRPRLICVHQLAPELALEVARPEVRGVLFVDTRAAGPGDDGQLAAIPVDPGSVDPKLGHYVNAHTILLYAQALYGKQAPAWSVTVPGWDFEHGEGFSPRVQALLAGADEFIGQVWARATQAILAGAPPPVVQV